MGRCRIGAGGLSTIAGTLAAAALLLVLSPSTVAVGLDATGVTTSVEPVLDVPQARSLPALPLAGPAAEPPALHDLQGKAPGPDASPDGSPTARVPARAAEPAARAAAPAPPTPSPVPDVPVGRIVPTALEDDSGGSPLPADWLAPVAPAEVQAAQAPDSPHHPASVVPVAVAGGALALFGVLALFHRLRKDELLEHRTRDLVHDWIGETPGITLQDLTKRGSVAYDTVMYHVERLEKEGLVVREGEKPARLFQRGIPPADRRAIVALRTEGAARVLAAIEAAPGIGKSALGRAAALTLPSVTWHIARLAAAGLVTVRSTRAGFAIEPACSRIALMRGRLSPRPERAAAPA